MFPAIVALPVIVAYPVIVAHPVISKGVFFLLFLISTALVVPSVQKTVSMLSKVACFKAIPGCVIDRLASLHIGETKVSFTPSLTTIRGTWTIGWGKGFSTVHRVGKLTSHVLTIFHICHNHHNRWWCSFQSSVKFS